MEFLNIYESLLVEIKLIFLGMGFLKKEIYLCGKYICDDEYIM